jgi:hypothetical protein
MVTEDSAAALLSLWRRQGESTPVEPAAIRSALDEPRDDGGFAERFLEEQQAARRAGTPNNPAPDAATRWTGTTRTVAV